MLWRACNLFAALVVVCVCLEGRGVGSGLYGKERACQDFPGDVACMYDEARETWLVRGKGFHR
jgi:hypothetical protein